MKKVLFYRLFFILIFINACNAQTKKESFIGINKDIETLNLKGPVKEVKSVVTTNDEDQYSIQDKLLFNSDNRVVGYVLYKNGLLNKYYPWFYQFDQKNNVYRLPSQNYVRVIDTIKWLSHYDMTEDRFSFKYLYDSLDLENKLKHRPKYSFVEQLGGSGQEQDVYKLFANYLTINRSLKDLTAHYYDYDIDVKGRIKTRKDYLRGFYDCINYKDSINEFQKAPFKYLKDNEDLKYKWDYYYDDKDRIVRLEVVFVQVENKRHEGGNIINKKIYEFDYNNDNKVTELRVYDTGLKTPEVQFTKTYKYEYHTIHGYMLSKEEILDDYYFYKRNDGGNHYYNDIHSKTYFNEHGDIIKREFLSELSKLSNAQKDPLEEWWRNPYAPRFYEYEYDQYNNWIKCTAYLRGVKTPKPSLVIEREITYYED